MNKRLQWLVLGGAAIIGLAAGIYFSLTRAQGDPTEHAIAAVYAATLPDLQMRMQPLSQYRDRTLIVNFWATWCIPCRTEIPGLVRIQARTSPKIAQIVGIALDNPEQVQAFAKFLGINYPVLIGGLETVDLTRAFGNRSGALPFTLVLGPGGKVVESHLGEISESELGALITRASTPAGG